MPEETKKEPTVFDTIKADLEKIKDIVAKDFAAAFPHLHAGLNEAEKELMTFFMGSIHALEKRILALEAAPSTRTGT